jgi:hypothetical protein
MKARDAHFVVRPWGVNVGIEFQETSESYTGCVQLMRPDYAQVSVVMV